tara:strand:+ start:1022 stop:1765 length:744 start_codon:yes stop_codon:yes gene_type:complete
MAFKMKAGKEGPMKKNFPSVFKQQTVELADGQTQIKATTQGLQVKGPGGKTSRYGVDDPGYAGAKQQFIDAGGQSPYLLGPSSGFSGMQGRKRDIKPMNVDVDGQMVTGPGPARRNYGPMTMKKSAMKAAKPDFPDIDGDGNTTESMKKAAADKKSANKMKKAPMKLKKAPTKMKKAPTKMKKEGAMKMKKEASMKMKKEAAMKMKKKGAMKMMKESPKKMMKKSPKKIRRGGAAGAERVLPGGKNR